MSLYKLKNTKHISPASKKAGFFYPQTKKKQIIMATYYNENTVIYLNGAFVKASEAKMDFYSQSLHYGYSVFEGIRSYKTVSGETRIFKATEHYDRLKHSALSINMPYTWSNEELIEATYEVLRRNNFQD